jgi:hypothetical protein
MDNLLFETTVPIILVTTQDASLFDREPIEFIRKQQDTADYLFSYRHSMIQFVQEVCNNKEHYQGYLHNFLQFCVGNLEQYYE